EAFPTRGINSSTGPETCNTYNMLKLSRQLWLVQPPVPAADFIERALFNHILSSQDPEAGGFVYFTSIPPGPFPSFFVSHERFLVLHRYRHGKPRQVQRVHLCPFRQSFEGGSASSIGTRLDRPGRDGPA